MNQATIWAMALVLVVVVIGGIVMSRSTTPATVILTTPTTSPASQFLQTAPSASPPAATASGTPSVEPVMVEGGTKASPGKSANTITMNDTALSPTSLTVLAGTTVTFVNNGQGAHQPASAFHPTHQVLPGFDAKRGLQTGETYTFTFTKPGTWSFHDHLNPSLTGRIIVQ